jgi:hypothetical protein
MGSRTDLQTLLEGILGSGNVYYQPPSTVNMKYPAIVYDRSKINNKFADNLVYKQDNAYTVTVIDRNPDSLIVDAISKLPTCIYDRGFTANNLNHDVFTLYY